MSDQQESLNTPRCLTVAALVAAMGQSMASAVELPVAPPQANQSLRVQQSDGPVELVVAPADSLRRGPVPLQQSDPLDDQLSGFITQLGLNPAGPSPLPFPDVRSPLAQLGKKLFYSKSLGGQLDSACASCHHPVLGGADGLSFSIGVDAVNPDLLGPGRRNKERSIAVPRNAPTVFNLGMWDTGLFWDSRVESLGKEVGANGSLSGIRTPESPFGEADTAAGKNLASAQAAFPVTSVDEMKGETFSAGGDSEGIRAHLAARIGNYGEGTGELPENRWLQEFQLAFGISAPAEDLVTFDRIAEAIGEFERSMVFTNNNWSKYLAGNKSALTQEQKRGALLFFTPSQLGGAGCAACHNGPLFSDGLHHSVAFPQFGPGKGDGLADDFGRFRESGDEEDVRYFRTPSLLNVAQTAPYGHAGTFGSLDRVVRHYVNPEQSLAQYFSQHEWCRLPQFRQNPDCESLYPDSEANSLDALAHLKEEQAAGESLLGEVRLNGQQIQELVSFLVALTDPCVTDRRCLSPWIADDKQDNPDGQVLIGVDRRGNKL